MSTFYVGQRVVTRSGKLGTVKGFDPNGDPLVAFWIGHDGRVLRESQVITESAWKRMQAGKPVPGQGVR